VGFTEQSARRREPLSSALGTEMAPPLAFVLTPLVIAVFLLVVAASAVLVGFRDVANSGFEYLVVVVTLIAYVGTIVVAGPAYYLLNRVTRFGPALSIALGAAAAVVTVAALLIVFTPNGWSAFLEGRTISLSDLAVAATAGALYGVVFWLLVRVRRD
jgi:hypothetical protein